MIDRFRNYLDKTFRYLPYTDEASALREEMLSGLMERAQDLKETGMSEDEIFNSCIESLGDYTETINALKRKPFAVLKDTKFQKSLLGSFCFILACVVTYLLLGVFFDYWGKGAVTIFPAMAGILYFFLMGSLLLRNVKFNRHATSGVIIGSLFTVFATALFFLLWALGVAPKYAWVTFTYIPLLVGVAHLISKGYLRKKKVGFPTYAYLIFTLTISLYLTVSMATGLWHPLWILFLIAIFAIAVWGVALIGNKKK